MLSLITMKNSSHTAINGIGAHISAEEFNDRYYDKQEVLQKFNISPRTLQEWRSQNLVTYIKIGKKMYYLKESLNKLIAESTITGKIDNKLGEIYKEGTETNTSKMIADDTLPSKQTDIKDEKSFAKLWNPIPGYMVPILVIIIYFLPFAEDIIKGEPILPFVLVLPLKIGVIGCAAFFFIQLAIRISRKYISHKNPEKEERK
jgi:hypothetical protein